MGQIITSAGISLISPLTMPLKLTYFPIRGLGEHIRTLLTDNEIPFENEIIPFDQWPALKESMPLHQLPVLTTKDGTRIPQSRAILRHLGRIYGLYGDNEEEKTHLDVLQEALMDLRRKYAMTVVFGDWSKKDDYDRETYPEELAKIEALFKVYADGTLNVLGEKKSFIDYMLYEELDLAVTSNPKNLDTVPLLKGFHSRFQQRPNLQEYIARRTEEKPKFMINFKI